jgi:trehalose 6-phosphate synthase/phosphatase
MDNMTPDPSPPAPLSIEEIQAQIEHLEQTHKEKGFPLSGRIIHLCHHLPVEITRVLTPPSAPESGANTPSLDQDGFMSPSIRSSNNFSGGVLPPQRMEEFKEPHSTTVVASDSNWKLASRRGHTAMISGMRSLSSTHEQIVVAWTGDVLQEYSKDAGRRTAPQTPVRPTPKRLQSIAGTAPGRETPAQPDMSQGTSIAATPLAPAVPEDRPEAPMMAYEDQPSVYMKELTDEEQRGLERELHKFSDHEVEQDKAGRMTYAPVFVPREIAKGHYEGYCKTSESACDLDKEWQTPMLNYILLAALWPLFHYLLWQDSPVSLPTPDPTWSAYQETNLLFAKRVAELYKPGDLIIVHDYHLLLVPKMIRECLHQVAR